MSATEMKTRLENFRRRIEILREDFDWLVGEFDSFEDEAACAWCGKRGDDTDLEKKCPHCGATFCTECWPQALECAQREKDHAQKAGPRKEQP